MVGDISGKVNYQNIHRTLTLKHSYPLAFATIGGSHAFGCASDASDYDIHGVYILPASTVLCLDLPRETIEFKETMPIEMDVATHDLKKFILLMLKGNGNVLEDLYSSLIICSSPLHEELQVLGRACITKKCAAHYKGMATNQQRRMNANQVKKYLHSYRCLLMGIHLMQTGELEMSIPVLASRYGYSCLNDLVEYKIAGITGLESKEVTMHTDSIEKLFSYLDQATQESQFPDKPTTTTREALEEVLIEARIGTL